MLHTKPRQEKSLARELFRQEIGYYLPVVPRRRKTRTRVRLSEVVLFEGYLFLFTNRDGYVSALSTGRIVRALVVPDQRLLWEDLQRLARIIRVGEPLTPTVDFEPGQEVEVAEGPLAGVRGRVIRSASGNRFVVEVSFIGRGVSLLCNGMVLRPVNPEVLAPG